MNFTKKRDLAQLIYSFLAFVGVGSLMILMDDWRWRVGTLTLFGLIGLAAWLEVSDDNDIEDKRNSG